MSTIRFLIVIVFAGAGVLHAAPASLTVDVDKPGVKISPTLWGIFFEDINLSADGGIYPEFVRNRSFEDSEQPDHWTVNRSSDDKSEIAIDASRPLDPMNRQSLRVKVDGSLTLVNKGYWGMNVVQGEKYQVRLAARAAQGFKGTIGVSLQKTDWSRVEGVPPSSRGQDARASGMGFQPMNHRQDADATKPRGQDARDTQGQDALATKEQGRDALATTEGATLFSCDFADGTKGWKLLGGDWKAQDGVLRQSSSADNVRAIAGDKSWTDYTYTLKARKLGGAEGFLILFNVRDESRKSWWNLGGWGNQRHAIEMGGIIGREVPGSIETGRWYDIRIETAGKSIKCYLDGKLIRDVTPPVLKSLYASASRAKATGEVILKVVNTSKSELSTDIKLNSVKTIQGPAQAILLTSEKVTDENSLANPTNVAPVAKTIDVQAPSFPHAFPGNSVTILRLKVQ